MEYDTEIEKSNDSNINNVIIPPENENEKPLMNEPQFKNKNKPKAIKKKLGLLEWILISMSIVVLVTSIALFIVFFIIDEVPSILLNENIIKSLIDTRKYEMIRLLNGIEVLLISDTNTSNSAVSLSVNAGIIKDEKYNVYGIGHLVKNIIVNGKTRKNLDYLITQAFGNTVSVINHLMDSSFSYDVGNKNFIRSIEAFAEMIKLSDLNDSNVRDRIIEAVDLIERDYQSEKSYTQENVLKKMYWSILGQEKMYFPFGSKNTFLNETFDIDDLTKTVLKYYRENYQGINMKIVVLTQLKIKEIRGIVIKLFSDISPGNSPPVLNNSNSVKNNGLKLSHPLPKSNFDLGKILIMKFNKPKKVFRVIFFIDNVPFNTAFFYFKYFRYLVDNQNQGSLSYLLKKDHFISRCYYLNEYLKNNTVILSLGFDLTQKGLLQVDDVLYRIYNYFKFLRNLKPNNELYDELMNILLTDFRYHENVQKNDSSHVNSLSYNMLQFKDNITMMLMDKMFLPEFNYHYLEALFKLLIPRNSIVLITLKHDTAEEGSFNCIKDLIADKIDYKRDDIYNVVFSINKFKDYVLKTFNEVSEYDNEFSLRKKNDYITAINYLVEPESKEEITLRAPEKILDQTHLEIWHKLDRRFRIPKSYFLLIIISPFHPSDDPKNIFLFYYHFEYILSMFNYQFSGASEAGSDITVAKKDNKIEIKVYTFDDLFEKILAKAIDIYYNIDTSFMSESLIKNITEVTIASYYKNDYFQKSFDFLDAAIKNNLTSVINPPPSYDSKYIIQEISKLLKQTYVRGLMYGNINQNNAKQIIEKYLLPYSFPKSTFYSSKYFLFNENEVLAYLLEKKDFNGNNIIHLKSPANDNTSYVGNFFFMGSRRNPRDKILIMFIKQIIQAYYTEELKKLKFNLGGCTVQELEENYYFVVLALEVNRLKLDPREMCRKMDMLFNTMSERIRSINEETELYQCKENVLLELNKKDYNLKERVKKVVDEIQTSLFEFDSKDEYTIEKLNKEFSLKNIIDKFDEIFYTNVKRISFQKNYTEEIDLSKDEYALNSSVLTMVTDDINYFHRKSYNNP